MSFAFERSRLSLRFFSIVNARHSELLVHVGGYFRVIAVLLLSLTAFNVVAIGTASPYSPGWGSSTSGAPCFYWNAASGATHYTIQVSTNTAFNASYPRWVKADLTTTSYCWDSSFVANPVAGSTPNPLPVGYYYWRIKAMDNVTGSQTQTTFSTSGRYLKVVPGTPTLSLATQSTDGNYTVSWTPPAGAISYYHLYQNPPSATYLEYGTSKNFSGKTQGNYSYQVRACEAGFCGNYSAVKTISVSLPPTQPTYPVNETVVGNSACFTWPTVPGATHYNLQVSPYSDIITTKWLRSDITPAQGANTLTYCWGNGSGFQELGTNPQSVLNFQQNGPKYWRVRAQNAATGSETIWSLSSTQTFTLELPLETTSLLTPIAYCDL